jgi:hypothetical protein
MKKIPTLFKRIFDEKTHKIIDITDEITPGCEEAFLNGTATVKMDGSCCAMINGVFYKRYDCKKGKTPPEGAIPCCDPDPVTGHWPHWVKVDPEDPANRWFCVALNNSGMTPDGTYEAIGPHFNGNPYQRAYDILVRHGETKIDNIHRDFESVKYYLENHLVEGIVFWLNGEPVCKIKRSDFGFKWPV